MRCEHVLTHETRHDDVVLQLLNDVEECFHPADNALNSPFIIPKQNTLPIAVAESHEREETSQIFEPEKRTVTAPHKTIKQSLRRSKRIQASGAPFENTR